MKGGKADHPYTALLTRTDERGSYVPKINVRLSDGSVRLLRPRWVGTYYGQAVNEWCVQRWGCAQSLILQEGDWPKWRAE